MARRPATAPASALRLLDDIDRAAALADAAGDDASSSLFTATSAAARDAMNRGTRLMNAPGLDGYKQALDANTAELLAWTPVVQQVHALAHRWLTAAQYMPEHAEAATGPGRGRLVMLRSVDPDPACTGGVRD